MFVELTQDPANPAPRTATGLRGAIRTGARFRDSLGIEWVTRFASNDEFDDYTSWLYDGNADRALSELSATGMALAAIDLLFLLLLAILLLFALLLLLSGLKVKRAQRLLRRWMP